MIACAICFTEPIIITHLGTSRGGMVVLGKKGFERAIHNIENAQFRSKFEDDLATTALTDW